MNNRTKVLVIILTHFIIMWQLFAFAFRSVMMFNYLLAGFLFSLGLFVLANLILYRMK